MLGSAFFKFLAGSRDFEMYATDRSEVDVTDFELLDKIFTDIKPNFVINCTAYTKVDLAETEQSTAFRLNADVPGELARLCKLNNCTLIHFSTDYVFDGENLNGYREDALPHPINVYGESKLKGEKQIEENLENFYIIRTSWLYGPNGKNFVSTMLKLAEQGDALSVVCDQFGCPTYTYDLVKTVIEYFLEPFLERLPENHEHTIRVPGHNFSSKKLLFGVYHITNSEVCSWYEFARKIFELKEVKVAVKDITTDQYPLPAKRPRHCVLLNKKMDLVLRSWSEALESYLNLLCVD